MPEEVSHMSRRMSRQLAHLPNAATTRDRRVVRAAGRYQTLNDHLVGVRNRPIADTGLLPAGVGNSADSGQSIGQRLPLCSARITRRHSSVGWLRLLCATVFSIFASLSTARSECSPSPLAEHFSSGMTALYANS